MAGKDLQRSRKARQDESVMTTNNSSMVSKRSVERTYYPEPHFFRYFVKKPVRVSPLIYRGHWLRMRAVEQVINQFLEQPSDKKRVVLNLGCGYDPLAFRCLSKQLSIRQGRYFIDVDFPDSMGKKIEIIIKTPQLRDLITPYERPLSPSGLFIRNENYLALGCDLRDTDKLDELLAKSFDISTFVIFCTAEASITNMDVKAASCLIKWAVQRDDIRFCLLEQFLPDGSGHPFAQKMMQYFSNLQTPHKSVKIYPWLAEHERRFLGSGWSRASPRSLWDVWNDENFVTSNQRLALNSEAFDEWEELALFASHYFLIADNGFPVQDIVKMGSLEKDRPDAPANESADNVLIVHSEIILKSKVRRFEALVTISPDTLGYYSGLGPQSRIGTTDFYGLQGKILAKPPDAAGIGLRMYHTISALDHGSLLVYGRISPEHALRHCWFLQGARWERVDDLTIPLYRHYSMQVTLKSGCQGVLTYGGKTDANNISGHWLLRRASLGWVQVIVEDKELTPRFGAALASTGSASGIFFGGMTADGTILNDIWEWTLNLDDIMPTIDLSKARTSWLETKNIIGRMGACLTRSLIGLLLVGDVSSDVLPQKQEIIFLSRNSSRGCQSHRWIWNMLNCEIAGRRPLLVGHSTLASSDLVTIIGVGAVCFSFGTYWDTDLITLSASNTQGFSAPEPDHLRSEADSQAHVGDIPTGQLTSVRKGSHRYDATTLTKIHLESPEDLSRIMKQGRPVIMCEGALGSCTEEWTLDKLKAKIGANRIVVVHETSNSQMDFQHRNFSYTKKSFQVFVDEIARGSKQYLRSLASEKPLKKPANFWADFPGLASDFQLPSLLDVVRQKIHSSVLRISGPVNMWLHYDVMANVLCQVRGTKRLLLYPPSDVSLFKLAPGASSSSMNCFEADLTRNPSLALAHPHEVLLKPGEILYIPPLWLHTASPIDTISIAVNVFFRNLESGYAPGRDVYGNRDVQAYEKGRKDIEKIAKAFDKLPKDMGRFYMERLADELKAKAFQHGS